MFLWQTTVFIFILCWAPAYVNSTVSHTEIFIIWAINLCFVVDFQRRWDIFPLAYRHQSFNIIFFLSFAGFSRTNWSCVKVWVAEEAPHALLGPLLWKQPRKGIYCWTLVAGPWSKTTTAGPCGPPPVGAPSTGATQTGKWTKSEPNKALICHGFHFFQPSEIQNI